MRCLFGDAMLSKCFLKWHLDMILMVTTESLSYQYDVRITECPFKSPIQVKEDPTSVEKQAGLQQRLRTWIMTCVTDLRNFDWYFMPSWRIMRFWEYLMLIVTMTVGLLYPYLTSFMGKFAFCFIWVVYIKKCNRPTLVIMLIRYNNYYKITNCYGVNDDGSTKTYLLAFWLESFF